MSFGSFNFLPVANSLSDGRALIWSVARYLKYLVIFGHEKSIECRVFIALQFLYSVAIYNETISGKLELFNMIFFATCFLRPPTAK